MLKNGTRLQSQVCDTQVIIVRSSEDLDDLRCGGHPLVSIGEDSPTTPDIDPQFAGGTIMGKRYVSLGGAEILVTKAGRGSLAIYETPLNLKEAKPLPASD